MHFDQNMGKMGCALVGRKNYEYCVEKTASNGTAGRYLLR